MEILLKSINPKLRKWNVDKYSPGWTLKFVYDHGLKRRRRKCEKRQVLGLWEGNTCSSGRHSSSQGDLRWKWSIISRNWHWWWSGMNETESERDITWWHDSSETGGGVISVANVRHTVEVFWGGGAWRWFRGAGYLNCRCRLPSTPPVQVHIHNASDCARSFLPINRRSSFDQFILGMRIVKWKGLFSLIRKTNDTEW